jgi:hypothetical protein
MKLVFIGFLIIIVLLLSINLYILNNNNKEYFQSTNTTADVCSGLFLKYQILNNLDESVGDIITVDDNNNNITPHEINVTQNQKIHFLCSPDFNDISVLNDTDGESLNFPLRNQDGVISDTQIWDMTNVGFEPPTLTAPVGTYSAKTNDFVQKTLFILNIDAPPVDTTDPPVDPSAPPVDPSAPPVDTTDPPVDPSAPPVDTSAPPVDTSAPPVDTSDPPVDTTDPPVDTTAPPNDQSTSAAPFVSTTTGPQNIIKINYDIASGNNPDECLIIKFNSELINSTIKSNLLSITTEIGYSDIVVETLCGSIVALVSFTPTIVQAKIDQMKTNLNNTTTQLNFSLNLVNPRNNTIININATKKNIDSITFSDYENEIKQQEADDLYNFNAGWISNNPITTTASPIDTTASPIDTTASPLDTTASPLDTTASPIDTTASPLDTTASPIDTTASPIDTTASPLDTTASPLDTTATAAAAAVLSSTTTAAVLSTPTAAVLSTPTPEIDNTTISNYYAFHHNTIIDDNKQVMNTIFAENNEDIMGLRNNPVFPTDNVTPENALLSAKTLVNNSGNTSRAFTNDAVNVVPNNINSNSAPSDLGIEIENINGIMKNTNQINLLSRDMFPQEPREFIQDMSENVTHPETVGLNMNIYSPQANQYQAPWLGKSC